MPRRKQPAIPNELLDQFLAGGDASAAFDQGGLLVSLKKALTERALNAEMDHHLSGEDGAGNSRNGYGRKTVMTDTGKMAIDVPRDRQASFDSQLIAKYQRRFPGFDEKIVSMYARGMSTREITGHLHDLYGIERRFSTLRACFRHFDNRSQVAAYAGLAPSPWQSRSIHREQGVSKAGNPRLRTTIVQLARLWLRHQPDSMLARRFHDRVIRNGGRLKKAIIVALARKLLVALWKYVTAGVVIEGGP